MHKTNMYLSGDFVSLLIAKLRSGKPKLSLGSQTQLDTLALSAHFAVCMGNEIARRVLQRVFRFELEPNLFICQLLSALQKRLNFFCTSI